jgi:hypothetical protein
LETPLEGLLFFYAWKTSFCFIAGDDSIDLLFPQDSLVSLSTAILLWSLEMLSYTHARVTPVAPLLVCVLFFSF